MDNEFKKNLSAYLDVIVQEKINLIDYAQRNKITIYKNGKMDKGWKGNAIEHLLNIPKNSNRGSDYGFLEVKTVPVYFSSSGELKIKETTCLNIISPDEVLNSSFEQSSLYKKIQKTVFIFISVQDENFPYVLFYRFIDMEQITELKNKFEEDYNVLAEHIACNIADGLPMDTHFNGRLGQYLQPRPKMGKNRDYKWAFFMKKNCWCYIM